MSVIELIEAVARRLEQSGVGFGHGTLNAFDEAAWLVMWRLGLPLDTLDAVALRNVGNTERGMVDALVDKRIRTRKPTAYLTNEAWLQGVPFYVDERVIVPRSFIAELIADGSLEPWMAPDTRKVLDLCTGNGSLAVLAAMAWPDVTVDASDISADALDVARKNVVKHQLGDRIRLVESDGLRGVQGPYDLILCNPPYVNDDSMGALPDEYQAEPQIALAGGEDGMDFIRPLLIAAASRLSPHGALVLEVGNERDNFEAAFPRLPGVWLETSAGSDSVVLLTREALRPR